MGSPGRGDPLAMEKEAAAKESRSSSPSIPDGYRPPPGYRLVPVGSLGRSSWNDVDSDENVDLDSDPFPDTLSELKDEDVIITGVQAAGGDGHSDSSGSGRQRPLH